MPQSLSSILIHLIFSTKNREPLITETVEPELHRYLGGILRNQNCPSIIIGGDRDHVHILLTLSRTISVAKLIEDLKSSSSKWIKDREMNFNTLGGRRGMVPFRLGNPQSKMSADTLRIKRSTIGIGIFRASFERSAKGMKWRSMSVTSGIE